MILNGGAHMLKDGMIWVGNTDDGREIMIDPAMANRHGLIAGATGTGKTVTLKVLAESFSDLGVPVFLADVKGDIAGIIAKGMDSEDMQERIRRFGLEEAGFDYEGYIANFWDIYADNGIPLRTTISEMGPILLARILELNELQTDVLSIIFKIADDNELLLIDTKDLKAMVNYVQENAAEFAAEYGRIAPATLGAIMRAVVALEVAGGDRFFGEPAINIAEWITLAPTGKGMINILDSQSLINNGKLYSTFLLWMLSELFETLPEVGDLDKPKLVFFFDEAHLLFKGCSKSLMERIEQVVKLVRSKGVGVYFCTQNPADVPDEVLAQLGNKIQHGLRAYTPSEQKAVRAAANSYRENPEFDTYETIMALGTGEAIVSFLQSDGVPSVCEKISVLPPKSRFGAISEDERTNAVMSSLSYSKYAAAVDPESAYEILERLGIEAAKAKEAELAAEAERKEQEAREKEEAKAREKAEKAEAKAREKEERERKNAAKKVGSTVAGTLGREVGKTFGGKFGGKFGKTLGGNLGASLGRGLLGTFFKG